MSHPELRGRKTAAHYYEQLTLFTLPPTPDGPSPTNMSDAVDSRAHGPAAIRRSDGRSGMSHRAFSRALASTSVSTNTTVSINTTDPTATVRLSATLQGCQSRQALGASGASRTPISVSGSHELPAADSVRTQASSPPRSTRGAASASVHHAHCGDCGAINDVPSLPTICYRCGWPVGL